MDGEGEEEGEDELEGEDSEEEAGPSTKKLNKSLEQAKANA